MAALGPTNIVARRVTDDLIVFSGETAVPKYMKFFLVQKLLTVVVAELQAMEDQDEVHDSLLAAKDAKRGEESKILALNDVIAKALNDIETLETDVEILDGENNVIIEYLMKISKKARILELKRRHLKIIILTSNTSYPSRKIRRICACTSQKTTKETRSIRRLRKKYRLSLKNDMPPRDKIDNPNINMEEYIRLEKEKARRHGKVYNWETAKYGKICSLNNNEIDFRISFDESDDEDYTVIFDKNSFSYKIISVNDLKTDSENDNEKVNMPSFPPPEPKVSCFDDLDFFKDFENEFPAIVYNDALTSKSEYLAEPTLCSQHIDEFDLKDETSLSKYDEVEQNVLYFNDLFPFNIIYLDDLKSGKDNDDNEIDIIQSSGGNVNTQGQKKFLEASHDKINKIFNVESFIMELKVKMGRNGNPFSFLKCRAIRHMALPPRDQRHQYLRDGRFSVNVLYLLARYLRLFASGRKQGAMISEGQFVARLAEHFGLLTKERLQGLTMIVRDLPVIDMAELVAAFGAPEAADDALIADEGAPVVPAPVQAPQPPPPKARLARAMAQRLARVEEDVQEI
ncbi:hypothetical protein Tco_0140325 [Tanacetum coccineum]